MMNHPRCIVSQQGIPLRLMQKLVDRNSTPIHLTIMTNVVAHVGLPPTNTVDIRTIDYLVFGAKAPNVFQDARIEKRTLWNSGPIWNSPRSTIMRRWRRSWVTERKRRLEADCWSCWRGTSSWRSVAINGVDPVAIALSSIQEKTSGVGETHTIFYHFYWPKKSGFISVTGGDSQPHCKVTLNLAPKIWLAYICMVWRLPAAAFLFPPLWFGENDRETGEWCVETVLRIGEGGVIWVSCCIFSQSEALPVYVRLHISYKNAALCQTIQLIRLLYNNRYLTWKTPST